MPGFHSLLSPSGAHRWMECTPSAQFAQRFLDTTSEYAEEGTFAHAVVERMLEVHSKNLLTDMLDCTGILHAEKYLTPALLEYCADFVQFLIELAEGSPILSETKLKLDPWLPGMEGTVDSRIVRGDTLTIVDLKYGKGVPVSAAGNEQLMIYALGAYEQIKDLIDINHMELIIYQPRIGNISRWEGHTSSILTWAEQKLKPAAVLAMRGEGAYKAGDHCKFCKARAVCITNRDYRLELAAYDFASANVMSPQDIADVLKKAAAFKSWLTAVENHALAEALQGRAIPGFKIVEGRGSRKYEDVQNIRKALDEFGVKGYLTNPELVGVTEMEKLIGKKQFTTLLGPYVKKEPGKPALVPEDDKRPEFNAAATDFAEFIAASNTSDEDEL